jgi:hypothetical protein
MILTITPEIRFENVVTGSGTLGNSTINTGNINFYNSLKAATINLVSANGASIRISGIRLEKVGETGGVINAVNYSIAPVSGGRIISVDKPQARAGTVVTVAALPNPGFRLDAVNKNGIPLDNINRSSAGFFMPEEPVNITVSFVANTDVSEVVFNWNSAINTIPDGSLLGLVPSGHTGIDFMGHGGSAMNMVNGEIVLNNARFSIGTIHNVNTTQSLHVPGQFNLSQGRYRIIIEYRNADQEGGYIFRVQLNNNSGSADFSVLGNGHIRGYPDIDSLTNGISPPAPLTAGNQGSEVTEFDPVTNSGRLILTFNPAVFFNTSSHATSGPRSVHPSGTIARGIDSLQNAFICLVPTGNMIISAIRLERLNP